MQCDDSRKPSTSLMEAGGAATSMDNAKWNRLHTLAAFCTLGGTALDGYILGLVGGAITAASDEMHFTPLSQGLIGASALIGIFIGGILFGRTADRWGRKRVFQWNLIAFVVLSVLQLFAVGTWDLTVYRVLMGVAIGVEYAVGAAMLSELVPTRSRGPLLASLQATWFAGFVAANFVALDFADANWRAVLASSALPAIVIAVARIWLPESPRWLAARGRDTEGQAVVDAHFPAGTTLPRVEGSIEQGRFSELFSKDHWRSTAYSGIFWACQVAPLFAIFTFITPVLDDLGLPSGFSRDFIMNMLQLVGACAFIWIVAATRRRPLVIWTFGIVLASLLVLGLLPGAPLLVLSAATGVYLVVAAGSANLEFVYPSEMFPTRLRSSGVGFAAAMSRVGAALATYLLPFLIDAIGINLSLLALALFPLIGFVASLAWAPETSRSAIH
ncbi:MFS transporter [Streptomyces benahoarensis]|uniref:MFS transporter n=1 Tax=Streptomyces benahoarensis TaxID=2595054 RepID=A0A553ZFI5_9ACTN|nr:MFS transporter [Streptomyces benahoarensis]TSB21333.1 MFS transporter [Streptomyces benahoarensis]TSB40213.1 MFS transporter [Streptomyces benahoarensis]